MIISEFYESQIEVKMLEKTHAEVIIYSNTETKMKEIMKELLTTREELARYTQNKNLAKMHEDRKTVHKRLNETIFDDDYVSGKEKEISVNYIDGEGKLKQAMV